MMLDGSSYELSNLDRGAKVGCLPRRDMATSDSNEKLSESNPKSRSCNLDGRVMQERRLSKDSGLLQSCSLSNREKGVVAQVLLEMIIALKELS